MRRVMPLLLGSIFACSPAFGSAQQPGARSEAEPPIVVTGVRIQDFRDRLAQCLARACPPDQDIAATAALAEALLVTGELDEAKRVTGASIDRNRRHATSYPEPVSGLYRADARLARHLGRDRQARRSTWEILRTLEAGIPTEDHRHFTARFEIADMQLALGDLNGARNMLDDLRRRAARAGRPDVAALAELRGLWLALIEDRQGPARARLIEYSRRGDSLSPVLRIGARMMLAKLYRDEGNAARSDELVNEVARTFTGQRRLVFAPPFSLVQREIYEPGSTASITSRLTDNFEDRWIDVGFWIQPNGRVGELEIVRESGSSTWAAPLLAAMRERVYTASSDDEPTYRLERYTYTAAWEEQTGSRILRRSPRARVEYFDLTRDAEPLIIAETGIN
ncbi:MAG: hypothetical protein KF780_07260 [Sphingomonas sp.]|nr:hypothetical protein [Sphingomonas sp.]